MIHQGGVNYWVIFTPLAIFQNIAFIHISIVILPPERNESRNVSTGQSDF